MELGALLQTFQQLHKQPLEQTALRVSKFTIAKNQPALLLSSPKQTQLPLTLLIVFFFPEMQSHLTKLILRSFYQRAYPNICYIKNSHDINISHKSCSDGVNKKLPSEISVKPDLTKDLKENKQKTNKQTYTKRHTHTQNKPYVNPVQQNSHYFDTI